jgi:acetylornithine deacetylase/succinyl-diaminopimelate desuccinylase-like protein
MPNANKEKLVGMITGSAEKYGLEHATHGFEPLYVSQESPLVQTAVRAVNGRKPETASYGTDGLYLQQIIPQMVVLGPGTISVAHTVGEFVPVDELVQAVTAYEKMIVDLCM